MSFETVSTSPSPSNSQREIKNKKFNEYVSSLETNIDENLFQRIVPSLYVYSSLHGCIDQLIPTSYKILETTIGLSPKGLGFLTFSQKFSQGFFALLSGVVCDRHINTLNHSNAIENEPLVNIESNNLSEIREVQKNKDFLKIWPAYLMMITTIGWGVVMTLMVFATNMFQMLIISCVLGVFMSLMGPLTQSIIGTFNDIGRSEHFGNLFLAQNIGRLFCISATANIVGQYFDFKWTLLMFSLLSFIFSVYLYKVFILYSFGKNSVKGVISFTNQNLMHVLNFSQNKVGNTDSFEKRNLRELINEYSYIIYNKSAWLMLLMGIVNGIPRHSLNFTMMWLQYCGLSPLLSTIVYSSSWISAILISPFVGKASDYVESLYPSVGRQVLAQSAIFLRIIFMLIFLRYIPWGSNYFLSYLIVSVLIGFMAGWPGVGAARPILCQIVEPHHRATLFAIFSLFETIGSASFGAPLVGILAQNFFGYNLSLKKDIGTVISNNNQIEIDILKSNANALANSMICMTVIPWILAIVLFGLLRLTYKEDIQKEGK
ncbi:hypothetical protein FG386_001840 [Cryptosporidium ryanae]|uniref:uncharacterized protein n=1 Tax=Cryptosporidium ryanae TaxID=515981 RepID=UPI00351A8909|nr:hypothetical protein FG386_001840 [Cryptosporidium ryanae]